MHHLLSLQLLLSIDVQSNKLFFHTSNDLIFFSLVVYLKAIRSLEKGKNKFQSLQHMFRRGYHYSGFRVHTTVFVEHILTWSKISATSVIGMNSNCRIVNCEGGMILKLFGNCSQFLPIRASGFRPSRKLLIHCLYNVGVVLKVRGAIISKN